MKQSEYDKRIKKYQNRATNAFFLLVAFSVGFLIFIMRYGSSHLISKIILYGLMAGGFICFCIWLHYEGKINSLSQEFIEPDEGYHVNMEITVTTVTPEDD